MREPNVGFVVCLQNNKVAGCVTDRQLCIDVIGADLDPASPPVRDVMTTSPGRVTIEDNIFACIDTMRSAGVVNRLPVVNSENELVGVVSLSDIAVIAQDLIKAVLLDTTHCATKEARLLTGAKRFVKFMRRPTKLDRFPGEGRARRVTIRRDSGLDYGGRPPRRGKKPANIPFGRRAQAARTHRDVEFRNPGTPGRTAKRGGRANKARTTRSRNRTAKGRATTRRTGRAKSKQRAGGRRTQRATTAPSR